MFEKTIQHLNVNTVIGEEVMKNLRKRIEILVVDDDVQGRLDESLRNCGYESVTMMRDVERIQDVERFQMILIDILGIGTRLNANGAPLEFQGLSLAEDIKRMYPTKKVIVFSATLQEFKANYILKTVVDGSFEKNPKIDTRNTIIDTCLRDIIDPKSNWLKFRQRLLDADVPITEVARLESYYVKRINGHKELDDKKIMGFFKNVKACLEIVKELLAVVRLFGLVS